MFCGQIVNGIAQGVHSLDARVAPPTVVKVSGSCPAFKQFPCWNSIDVWDENGNVFVRKPMQPGLLDIQFFYPYTPVQLVSYLTTLYNSKNCLNIIQPNARNCFRVSINNILDHVTVTFVNAQRRIKTAWPIRPEDEPNANCLIVCKVAFTGEYICEGLYMFRYLINYVVNMSVLHDYVNRIVFLMRWYSKECIHMA